VGAGDAVVPAQTILVKHAPEIAKASGKRGKKRCEHAPAAAAAIEGGAVTCRQPQPGGAKYGSGAGVYDEQELVGSPQHDSNADEGRGNRRERPAKRIHERVQTEIQTKRVEMKKDSGKRRQRSCH